MNGTDEPVRVLMSGSLARGGVQTHMLAVCQALREAGAEVTVAAPGTDWAAADLQSLAKTCCRVVGARFGLASLAGKVQALTTWPILLRRDFDTLYCFGYGRMHLWMKRYLAPGGFGIYHEIVEALERPFPVAVRSAHALDGIIVNSELLVAPYRGAFPDKPIRHIQMFSGRAAVSQPAPRPAAGERELRVAYLGRVVAHKQTDWLVKQWDQIAALPPLAAARLDVYGKGEAGDPLLDELRAFAKSRGQVGRIALHGEYRHEQLPEILAGVDVVVLPSLWDAVPLVLVEAMQRGVPIVAMATGGVGELAYDNPDVEITPPRDNAAFVDGLQRMAGKLRSGAVDARRLHEWAESRYGYAALTAPWTHALMKPREFFGPTGGTGDDDAGSR